MKKLTITEVIETIGDNKIICNQNFVEFLKQQWWEELVTYEESLILTQCTGAYDRAFVIPWWPNIVYKVYNPDSFAERSKANPFTLEDWNGRTVYFNDGVSEYIETEDSYTLDLIEQLKSEAEAE